MSTKDPTDAMALPLESYTKAAERLPSTTWPSWRTYTMGYETNFQLDEYTVGLWSFNEAQKFAETTGAKLHLLFVNTPREFKTTAQANETISNFVKDVENKNFTINIYNHTSIERGILQFAQDVNAQLIGMSTHGRKGLSHFFNGSVSEDLVNHANMPVITFKIE